MKSTTPAGLPPLSPPAMNKGAEIPGVPTNPGRSSFKDVLAGVNAAMQQSSDIFRSIAEFQDSVVAGKAISPKDLLVFQIRASQFGLHVELLSKVAESGLSSVRRLQQAQ